MLNCKENMDEDGPPQEWIKFQFEGTVEPNGDSLTLQFHTHVAEDKLPPHQKTELDAALVARRFIQGRKASDLWQPRFRPQAAPSRRPPGSHHFLHLFSFLMLTPPLTSVSFCK
jgi:hypothetical protein